MSTCWGCGDELNAINTASSTCSHACCATCFMARMQVALKGADRIDPFACPVCKDPGGFVGVQAVGKYSEEIARAHRYAPYLWRCNIGAGDAHDEDVPPVLTPQAGKLPAILYMTYWHNHNVLLAADRVTCEARRNRLLRRSLVTVGDSVKSRIKRGATEAALMRMHTSLGKRRRLDAQVLEEARGLVDLLEEEAQDDEELLDPPVVKLYMVLVIKDKLGDRECSDTCVWLHTDIGTAVAFTLRAAVVPTWCVALIHAGDGAAPPAVLAAVDAAVSGPPAAQHVMRCLCMGKAGRVTEEQANFLSVHVQTDHFLIEQQAPRS